MSKQLVTPAPLLTELPFFVFVVGGGILHRPSLFCTNYSCVLLFAHYLHPRSTEPGSMSLTLEQFLASSSYNQTSDFYRTALVILALLFAVTVMLMLVIVTFYTVINIT